MVVVWDSWVFGIIEVRRFLVVFIGFWVLDLGMLGIVIRSIYGDRDMILVSRSREEIVYGYYIVIKEFF